MKEGWDDRATWPPKRRADLRPACATSTTSRGCDKSQLKQFFFWRYACTLRLIALFGKSLGYRVVTDEVKSYCYF